MRQDVRNPDMFHHIGNDVSQLAVIQITLSNSSPQTVSCLTHDVRF